MVNEIIKINIDLIRELKIQGKYGEANALLKAYHESNKKQKKQDEKEIKDNTRKIKKHYNICTTDCCKNETDGTHIKCEACRLLSRKYYKKIIHHLK